MRCGKHRGIIPPMVTPLADPDTLDLDGLERIIEHILAGGVNGLFVLGTTGEGPSLSYNLRREVIAATCRFVNKRVPVYVAVTDTAYAETLSLGRYAADYGADFLVLATPYYYVAAGSDLLQYTEQAVRELPLPVFLYNIPSLTKAHFSYDIVRRSLDWPNCVGLKDSSCDVLGFHKMKRTIASRSDFSLLVGPEEILAETVMLGADGGVNGGANLFPSLYVETFEAADAQDARKAVELQGRILDISDSIYGHGQSGGTIIQGLKCALACLGLCKDVMAQPFPPLDREGRLAIHAELERLDLL